MKTKAKHMPIWTWESLQATANDPSVGPDFIVQACNSHNELVEVIPDKALLFREVWVHGKFKEEEFELTKSVCKKAIYFRISGKQYKIMVEKLVGAFLDFHEARSLKKVKKR